MKGLHHGTAFYTKFRCSLCCNRSTDILLNVKILCPRPLHLPGSKSQSSWPLHLQEPSTLMTVELWMLSMLCLPICIMSTILTLKEFNWFVLWIWICHVEVDYTLKTMMLSQFGMLNKAVPIKRHNKLFFRFIVFIWFLR